KAGHEPIRRGVEHGESDVRRGTGDQYDCERQIAENAPAPLTGCRRIRLRAGLAGQHNPRWKSEKAGRKYRRTPRSNGERGGEFQGAAVRKDDEATAQKVSCDALA